MDIEDRKRDEDRLQRENAALREEINQVPMFEEIVGSSESLQKVLAQVSLASEFPGCACRHAQASRVEVAIHYGSGHFWLRIVDNGKGIDPTILAKGGRSGHHGLPGMKERARLARGKLTLASKPESGTEIEVTIPASLVYTNPASRHGRWLRERSLTQPGYRELPQSRDRWPISVTRGRRAPYCLIQISLSSVRAIDTPIQLS